MGPIRSRNDPGPALRNLRNLSPQQRLLFGAKVLFLVPLRRALCV